MAATRTLGDNAEVLKSGNVATPPGMWAIEVCGNVTRDPYSTYGIPTI